MVFSDPYSVSMVKTGCLLVLEKQINKLLSLDPVTLDRLSDHFGCVVAFHCLEPDVKYYVTLLEQQVRISGVCEDEPDVCFSGSGVSFSRLAGDRRVAFNDVQGLSVTGDEPLIKALEKIHLDMSPDWEKPCVNLLGVIPGHWLAQGVRFAGRQFSSLKETAEKNLSEYIQEELQLLPSRVEIEGFQADVENLKGSVDKLAEKIETLSANAVQK